MVSNTLVSDHCPIICTWSCKPRKLAKGHTAVQYRSFKHSNNGDFLKALSCAPAAAVFWAADPTTALIIWYEAFLPVIKNNNMGHFGRRELNTPLFPSGYRLTLLKP